MFNTPCKNCIFAIYKEDTQTECDLNRLEHFRAKNIEIIEAYDEDKEFYVIKDRLCTSYRGNKWGEKFNKNNWVKQLKTELSIKYSSILIIEKSCTLNDILDTFDTLLNIKREPKKIFIINLNPHVNRIALYSKLQPMSPIPIRIEQPVDMANGPNTQIDLLVRTTHIAAPFYLTINAGDLLPLNFIEKIETMIFEDLKQVGAVTHNNNSVVLYSTPIHVYCGGNKKTSLLDKLKKEQIIYEL